MKRINAAILCILTCAVATSCGVAPKEDSSLTGGDESILPYSEQASQFTDLANELHINQDMLMKLRRRVYQDFARITNERPVMPTDEAFMLQERILNELQRQVILFEKLSQEFEKKIRREFGDEAENMISFAKDQGYLWQEDLHKAGFKVSERSKAPQWQGMASTSLLGLGVGYAVLSATGIAVTGAAAIVLVSGTVAFVSASWDALKAVKDMVQAITITALWETVVERSVFKRKLKITSRWGLTPLDVKSYLNPHIHDWFNKGYYRHRLALFSGVPRKKIPLVDWKWNYWPSFATYNINNLDEIENFLEKHHMAIYINMDEKWLNATVESPFPIFTYRGINQNYLRGSSRRYRQKRLLAVLDPVIKSLGYWKGYLKNRAHQLEPETP